MNNICNSEIFFDWEKMGKTKKLINVIVIKFLGFLLIFPLGCDTTDPPSNDSLAI